LVAAWVSTGDDDDDDDWAAGLAGGTTEFVTACSAETLPSPSLDGESTGGGKGGSAVSGGGAFGLTPIHREPRMAESPANIHIDVRYIHI